MNVKTLSKAGPTLLFLSALSCASLFADTYTVQVTSTPTCFGVANNNYLALCNTATAEIYMQQNSANSTSQQLNLGWALSSGATASFAYKLSVTSLAAGTYSISTPSGTYTQATVAGVLSFNYAWTTSASGGGAISIAPAVVAASASFVSSDYSTEGTWTGKYGANGYVIAEDSSNLPTFATLSINGASLNTWANPTTDTRGLQVSRGSSTRLAADWYSTTGFSFNLNVVDCQPHNVSLYMVDWTGGRNQGVQITDAATGKMLDQEWMNSFTFGRYWTWTITGNVIITVVNNGGANAVASGLFFD